MKISLNWLNDYIELAGIEHDELAEKMIMFGFEDAEIKPVFQQLDKVVVGKILEIEKHPNADKLSYCKVDSGEGILNIVCGAPNIQQGNIVPLAKVGAVLPNGLKLKKTKIRGVESQGMMCSQKELHYGTDAAGIFILPDNWELGKPLKDYLNDHILDFEVKSNRPDLLNHIGVARELAALLRRQVTHPEFVSESEATTEFKVEIENPEDCGRYVAKSVVKVEVKPSPDFMRFRMNVLELSSRNNLVDISNYVLFEYGHPVHIFDADKIEGKRIIVRRAKKGEKILALDENTYDLDSEILVIADENKPIAIAGVMGGLDFSVTKETKNILIESAYFDPILVRRGAKKLGLSTDASYRFERGTDIRKLDFIADRVGYLVKEFAGGKLGNNVDQFPLQIKDYTEAKLRVSRVNKVLGTELDKEQIKTYLEALNFELLNEKDDTMLFRIPTYRNDVSREIDLIEEVGRMFGYENINTTFPSLKIRERIPEPMVDFLPSIRSHVSGLGLKEVINIAIYTEEELKYYFNPEHLVTLRNPVGQFLNKLRPVLVPGIVGDYIRNYNRGNKDLQLFEIGRVFRKSDTGEEIENNHLGLLLSGYLEKPDWKSKGKRVDYFVHKGLIETLCRYYRIKNLEFRPVSRGKYPGINSDAGFEIFSGDNVIGYGGLISDSLIENIDIDEDIYVCEINLDKFRKYSKGFSKFKPFSRYPSVRRDLALVFDESISFLDIMNTLTRSTGKLVKGIELFDVYKGKNIPAGTISYAFSIELQSGEKTLEEKDIDKIINRVLTTLEKEHGAKLREQ